MKSRSPHPDRAPHQAQRMLRRLLGALPRHVPAPHLRLAHPAIGVGATGEAHVDDEPPPRLLVPDDRHLRLHRVTAAFEGALHPMIPGGQQAAGFALRLPDDHRLRRQRVDVEALDHRRIDLDGQRLRLASHLGANRIAPDQALLIAVQVRFADGQLVPPAPDRIERHNAVIVGVGDVEPLRQPGQAARFEELQRPLVTPGAGLARARHRRDGARRQVGPPDLMVEGVGDVDFRSARAERQAERVLQPGASEGAIGVAVVKQAVPDERLDVAVGEARAAQGADFAVGEVKPPLRHRQPRGLRQRGVVTRTVDDAFAAAADPGLGVQRLEIHAPDLVRPRHGDVEPRPRQRQVPRAVEPLGQAAPAAAAVEGLGPGPQHRFHPAAFQVHAPDQVIAVIGHVDQVARGIKGEPLRIVEGRARQRAVGAPRFAGADRLEQPPRGVDRQDAMVVGVGDKQAPARRIGRDLARVGQAAGRGDHRLLPQHGGMLGEQSALAALAQQRLHRGLDLLGLHLARDRPGHAPLAVDENQRRPGADAILIPDAVALVDEHRMAHAVTQDGFADVGRPGFVGEFMAVDTDHDDRLPLEVFLDPLQAGQEVQAVDAAVSPEIENDDAALEVVLKTQWPVGVPPGQTLGELRSGGPASQNARHIKPSVRAARGAGAKKNGRRPAGTLMIKMKQVGWVQAEMTGPCERRSFRGDSPSPRLSPVSNLIIKRECT